MANPEAQATFGHKTQNKGKKKTTYKTKKMSNTNPTKKTGVNPYVLAKSKQFLFLIRHLACY